MTFAALSLAAVLGLAFATAAAVVAMYLLRRTPRPHTVSSVAFWRRAAERSRPRSPLATRIPWAAMLLSLAIATLLVLELGDPRPGAGAPGSTVLVVAADRTMATTDARGRRRLDEALAAARATAQASTVDGRVAVVRAGVRAGVVAPLTRVAADVDRALADVDVDDGVADVAGAISLARSIVRGGGGAGRVVVLSDRDDFTLTVDAIPVAFVPVGAPGETLAITGFDARRDPSALGEYHVRCEVRSYAGRQGRARLVIRDRGTVIAEEALTLAPGELREHRARGFSSAQAELTASLEDVALDGGRDALARDDLAYAALAPVAATRVLLVTPGDRYLADALGANPSVDLEVVDAAGFASRRRALGRYNVVVLDRVAPDPPVDHPALLLVGVSAGPIVRVGRELTTPRVTAVATEHRVLAGLRLDQVRVERARALVPEADDRVLVRSGRDALAIARDRGDRVVALGFDSAGTDLPRRVAFPLFIHNTLVWLDRREREYRAWQPPGEPIGGRYDTGAAGLQRVGERVVAVSAAELSGAIPAVERRGNGGDIATPGRASLALVLALVTLALLCGEWWLTARGRLR